MQAQIISIKTFDANKGTTISFDWAGSAISKIRCIIKTNDSSEEVYNEIYESSSVIFAPYTYKFLLVQDLKMVRTTMPLFKYTLIRRRNGLIFSH